MQGLDMLVDDVDTTPAKAGSGIFVFFELLLFAAAQVPSPPSSPDVLLHVPSVRRLARP